MIFIYYIQYYTRRVASLYYTSRILEKCYSIEVIFYTCDFDILYIALY